MKFLMENWRKWTSSTESKKRDFPADGHQPINPRVGSIHQGGQEDIQMPILNPPDEVPRGAPIQNRRTIHNLSQTAEEILDPETGEIDPERVHQHIDHVISRWGPEGDPERDELLALMSARIEDAISNLMYGEREEDLDEEEIAKRSSLARSAAVVQAMLRVKNPEFLNAPGKIVPSDIGNSEVNPHADTEIENIFALKPKSVDGKNKTKLGHPKPGPQNKRR